MALLLDLGSKVKIGYHRIMEISHHIYVFGATIVMLGTVLWPDTSSNFKEQVFTFIFAIYFILILIFLITFGFLYGRKSRYAEANKPIADSLGFLKEAYRYLDCCNSTDQNIKFHNPHFVDLLVKALTGFNNAFTLTSSVSCRASLKIIGREKPPNDQSTDAYNNSCIIFL